MCVCRVFYTGALIKGEGEKQAFLRAGEREVFSFSLRARVASGSEREAEVAKCGVRGWQEEGG